jgi:hypothetical protein
MNVYAVVQIPNLGLRRELSAGGFWHEKSAFDLVG